MQSLFLRNNALSNGRAVAFGTGSGTALLLCWCARIAAVVDRQRQRRALGRLDARLLRDIGVDADVAAAEAAKSPWQD